jgi:hypothetical protein
MWSGPYSTYEKCTSLLLVLICVFHYNGVLRNMLLLKSKGFVGSTKTVQGF